MSAQTDASLLEKTGEIFLSEGFALMLAEARLKSRNAGPEGCFDVDRLSSAIHIEPPLMNFILAFMMAWDRASELIIGEPLQVAARRNLN